VFENRPGGGNVIGTQAAVRSAPDGYTFFFASAAALVTDPYTFKSLPYDPMKDFTVISRIAEVTFTVLAHPDVPAKSLPELFAYTKAKTRDQARDRHRRSAALLRHDRRLAQQARRHQHFLCAVYADDPGPAGRDRRPGALPSSPSPQARDRSASGKLRALAVTSEPDARLPDMPAVAGTFPGFDLPAGGCWRRRLECRPISSRG
jgi:tripartite-type tricarboxylate transporter receptor subunit TctC